MKKGLLLLLLSAQSIAYAQPGCSNPHRIFTVPVNKTPTVVTKLGTDPQFPIMCNLDNADLFYKNLQAVAEIKGYKDEINSLFISIGYTGGVKDPRFTRDKVWADPIPFGSIGMLGDGKHKYVYSLLALQGENMIKAWHIKALSGCDLYFMNKCGNAFYYTNPQVAHESIVYRDKPGSAKMKLKIIARYDSRETCVCNDCEETSFIKGDIEKAVLADEKFVNIPITSEGAAYPERKIYIDVDKQTFKRIRNYDIYGKYDKHQCSDECGASCEYRTCKN